MNANVRFLHQVRNLIDAGWTQGYMATMADGRYVGYTSSKAVNFCLVGAMNRVEYGGWWYLFMRNRRFKVKGAVRTMLEDVLITEYGWHDGLVLFNDSPETSQGKVIALVDAAIQKAQGAVDER